MRNILSVAMILIFVHVYCFGTTTVTSVRGVVVTQAGQPLSYANVFFPTDLSGDVTDEEGCFEIRSELKGEHQLVVMYIGYEKTSEFVKLGSGDVNGLLIVMKGKTIELKKVSVAASSFSISGEEGMALSALDVITTAGAAADIMRAVQTVAGVTNIDEGAGLFVRGGDVSETKVMLDNGLLRHPYKFESPTGGYFGTFSPFLLSGTFFSSGGFSAKYGNALSGVLAMESLGMPHKRTTFIGLGLAATSASCALPLVGDKFGLRFSGNKSSTHLLFDLNGGKERFSRTPTSDDANLSLHYRYSKNGSVKGFVYVARERIGVEAITPTLRDFYLGDEWNRLYLFNWKQTISHTWLIRGTVSNNKFSDIQNISVLDFCTHDNTTNVRLDIDCIPNDMVSMSAGIEHNRTRTRFEGKVPYDPNDVEGANGVLTFNKSTTAVISSGYVQGEFNVANRWFFVSGLRFDRNHRPDYQTMEPRLSINYQLAQNHLLKIAAGIYHQYPDAFYYDPHNGNPDLKPMEAKHAIAGWEYFAEPFLFRVEVYYKRYSELILKNEAVNYNNAGYGYARGIDVFAKREAGMVSGWVAYSYVQSRRKEKLYAYLVPTDYDISHNFKIAGKLNLSPLWGISVTYRYATGRPYHLGNGQWNAGRGPAYQKLDMSFSYLVSFFRDNLTVFYISVGNVLATQNVIRHTYSPDYREHYQQKSFNRRVFYFGASFGF